jgi:hypothetical protein
MLSNSAFAGLLAAVYLTWLLLHLNPSVPLTTAAVGSLFTVMVLSYGIHIFVVSYVLYVLRQIALGEPSAPGWISLRLLTWSSAALSGAAAVVTWLHASGLRDALDPRAYPGVTRAAGLFGAATMLFLLLGVAQLAARRRGRATVAILFTLATIASIVAPVLARDSNAPRSAQVAAGAREAPRDIAPGPTPAIAATPARRVVLLCLDGASLELISPAVAAGRLPNFARLLDRGASMHLATTRPTQAEPAWASALTGKWPAKHGIRGAARYRAFNSDVTLDVLPDYLFSQALVRYGLLVEEPHTSSSVRAMPIWRLLDRYDVASGIVGLPLTHPAERTDGFVVSDRFHRRGVVALGAGRDVEPAEAEPVAVDAAAFSELSNTLGLAGGAGVTAPPAARLEMVPRTAESASLLAADQVHRRIAAPLAAFRDVRLLAIRYPGLDAVGHYYLRYARPDAFGDVSEDERRQYGRVLDDYYAYVDSLVGDALSTLRGDDVLVVVSAFGMEPLPFGKRLLERVVGDDRFTGTHERAPDGFLMAFGAPVVAGRLSRGAVVDLVPTLLYFLGLPIGRDMDGSPLADIFARGFNSQQTLTFIPAYEGT